MRALFPSLLLGILVGCGSLRTRSSLDTRAARRAAGEPLPVLRGLFVVPADIAPELRDPLLRYLRDVLKAELRDSGAFVLMDGSETALLSEYGIAAAPVAAAWRLELSLLRLEEKSGATVSFVLASSQSKRAEAEIELRLQSVSGGEALVRRGRGTATKGAWGLIAGVDRAAMREGRGAWKLDGSMAGLACAAALREAVDALADAPLSSARPPTHEAPP